MNTIDLLKEKSKLNENDEYILEYIQDHLEEIPHISSRELARRTYTSSTAVIRLARKLGFENYSEFKLNIITMLKSLNDDDLSLSNEDMLSIMSKMSSFNAKVIQQFKDELSIKTLSGIVELLSKTKYVDIIAKDSKVIVSDRYVENMAKQTEQNQINQFKQYGIDLNEYLKLANTTLEAFHANCKTQTVNQINTYAILEAVGTANKIEVSQKDIEEYFGGKEKYDSLMETAKTQEGKNPNFSIEGYIEQIKASLLEQKVKDFLIENN